MDGSILIAPFWDDIDTTTAGEISYRYSNDQDLLVEVGAGIRDVFENTFSPSVLFIATWNRVAGIGGSANPDAVRIINGQGCNGINGHCIFSAAEHFPSGASN